MEEEVVIKKQHLITVLDGAGRVIIHTFHRKRSMLLALNHLLSRLYKELRTEWCSRVTLLKRWIEK